MSFTKIFLFFYSKQFFHIIVKYEFDWKTFLKAKEEDFDAFIKKPDDKIELLQCILIIKKKEKHLKIKN